MQPDEKLVVLNDNLLIGKGNHKACYLDPRDTMRCIKVPLVDNDSDLNRELLYRRIRRLRGQKTELVPSYYGPIRTNLGKGYVFEKIVNFDGSKSAGLREWLNDELGKPKSQQNTRDIEQMLLDFRDQWLAEKLIVTDIVLENLVVQICSDNPMVVKLRMVDGFGTHAAIPIYYFLDFWITRQIKNKYWNKLLRVFLKKEFPDFFDDARLSRLDFQS